MQFDDETEKLLQERGLKCICQLCDCGRPHRHNNCRKPHPNNMILHPRRSANQSQMKTDYQSRFTNFHPVDRPEPIRPIERPAQSENLPAMDFRTENHESFKLFGNVEKLQSCKLRGEIEKLTSGKFTSQTIYNDTFRVHQIKPLEPLRPVTMFKTSPHHHFHADTEYNKNFLHKDQIAQESFNEAPSLAYDLLYPDGETIPQKSLKNLVHDGRRGEMTTRMPKIDHVLFGTEENSNVLQTTTNNEHFKEYKLSTPTKSMKPTYHIKPRQKFSATTQNKADFRYDENEAKIAKGDKCREHPSLLKLSMDIPADFKSVNHMSYHAFPISKIPKRQERYQPSTDTFDAKTMNQTDFTDYGIVNPTKSFKLPEPRKSSAKIQKHSSYMAQFKSPGKIDRIIYGDQHQDNIHLPPKNKLFTKESVTKKDFSALGKLEKTKSYKPIQFLSKDDKFENSTEYTDMFKNAEFEPCIFPRYLAKEETRRMVAK